MPLWHIHHAPDTYSEQDKKAFAQDITSFYTRLGLPKFYVMVMFHEMDPASFYIGGEPSDAAVRISIGHIARHTVSPEERRLTGEALNALIAPFTTERGLYVEFNIDEAPQDLWMIDGLWPPANGSEAEKTWAKANKPLPYA